jgi:hypothetical protein
LILTVPSAKTCLGYGTGHTHDPLKVSGAKTLIQNGTEKFKPSTIKVKNILDMV